MKLSGSVLAALIVLISLGSCQDFLANPLTKPGDRILVTSVSTDVSEISLFVTSPPQVVTATVLPVFAANQAVVWSVADPSLVAMVPDVVDSHKARVSGLRYGTTTIVATSVDGSKTISVPVHVGQEPVSAPTAASGTILAQVSWTPPANPDFDHVVVTTTSNDSGATLAAPATMAKASGATVTLSGLAAGKNYTFTIVAYDLYGNASAPVSVSQPTYLSTPAPIGVLIDPVGDGTSVRLAWTDPSYLDLSKIRIRTTSSDGGAVPGSYSDINKGAQVAIISGLTLGKNYTFDLTTLETGGNESIASPISTLTKVYKYKFVNSLVDSGFTLNLLNAYDSAHPTAHDAIVARNTDYNSAGNYPVRVNCDVWIMMPALSDPLDRSIFSLQNVNQIGKYLRINSAATNTAPANVSQWYGWSIAGMNAAAKEYYVWVDAPATFSASLSDASFKLLPAVNGVASSNSIVWAPMPSRYLLHAYYHVVALLATNSQYTTTVASWTLVAQ